MSDLFGIWGTAYNNIFAVGESGTILHYEISSWSSVNSQTTNDLYNIWGYTGTDVFSVGESGTIAHFNGTSWNSIDSDTTSDLYDVWGTNGSDVFMVGESGTICHFDGSEISFMNRNTSKILRSVWGFSPTDVFAVGWSGTILRYLPPAINTISLDQGYQGDILNVIISGTNLSGVSEIKFGSGIAVNSFNAISSTKIMTNITIVGTALPGSRDISVTTPGGSFVLPNRFTVKSSLPSITSISPDVNRQGETFNITITGTNLNNVSEVRFGNDISVNSFTALSSNQITANITIVADAQTGTRNVSITTSAGSFTLPASFTVKPALPTIISINPDSGNRETTLNIIIDGTNLSTASEVLFGKNIIVNSFIVLSSNQISANISIPASSDVGFRDVSVTTLGGSFAFPNSFTIKPALPKIISISPDSGSQGATLNVTIFGTNLSGASEIRLGAGIAVNNFKIASPNLIETTITILTSANTGAKDVSVTTPGGNFIYPNGFIVKQGVPTISSISPEDGIQGKKLTVIISGSNLEEAIAVNFGAGTVVQSFTNLSPTQLSVNLLILEDAVTGVRDVGVTTLGGSSTLSNSFNIKEKSTATLFLALLWVGIAIVVALFIFILNLLKKKRSA
jgi:hypothetical protein